MLGDFQFVNRVLGENRTAMGIRQSEGFWGVYKTFGEALQERIDPFSRYEEGIAPDADLDEQFVRGYFSQSRFDLSSAAFDFLDALWSQHNRSLDFWNTISERSGGENIIQIQDAFVGLGSFLWCLAIDSRSPVSASIHTRFYGLEIRLTNALGAVEIEVFAWSEMPSPLVEFAQGIASKGWKFTPFDYRGQPISTQLFKRVLTDDRFDSGELSLTNFMEAWTAIVGRSEFRLRSSSENQDPELKVRLWSADDWAQTRLSVRQSWMEHFMRDLP
jgi:hypothetical protein